MILEFIIRVLKKVGFYRLVEGIFFLALMGFLSFGLTVIVSGISVQFVFGLFLTVLLTNYLVNRKGNQGVSIITTVLIGFLVLFLRSSGIPGIIFPGIVRIFLDAFSEGLLEFTIAQYGEFVSELFALTANAAQVEINAIHAWIFNIEKPASAMLQNYLWGIVAVIIGTWVAHIVNHQRRPIEGVSVPAVLLGAGLAYKWESAYILLIYIGIGVLLILWNQLMTKEAYWDFVQLDFPLSMRLDSFIIGLASITILILAAVVLALLPLDYTIQKVYAYTEPVVEVLSEQLEEIGIVRSKPENQGENFRSSLPVMPREHLIGMTSDLSHQTVFEASLASDSDLSIIPLQYRYWKVSTYDVYTGNGWKNSDLSLLELDDFENPVADEYMNKVVLDQTINVLREDLNRLVYTGIIVRTNSRGTVAVRTTDNLTGQRDVFSISTSDVQYTVRSVIPLFSDQALIEASEAYPDWIRETYLALPESVPERVFQIASELTQDHHSNYEKARAIESYLKSIPYSLDIPTAPEVPDIVDYFLFELGTGYCDYYASAMAVMARAVGIPSRLVIGYVPGVVSDDGEQIIVSESDAHSWAELYFPGYGWIPFEPTGGREEVVERNLSSPITDLQIEEISENLPRSPGEIRSIRRIGFIVLAFLLSGLAYILYRRANTSQESLLRQIFYRFMNYGNWIGIHLDDSTTPLEFSEAFIDRVRHLTGQSRWGYRNIETITHAAITIVDVYSSTVFGGESMDRQRMDRVSRLWRRLQIQLLVVIMVYYYQNAFKRMRVFESGTR